MDTRTPQAANSGAISAGKLAIFAAAGLPVGGYVTSLAVYLPNYYTRHLGLSFLAVAGAFTVIRVFDVLLDPALGVVMDSTKTSIGRFRPWLAASVPVLMAATIGVYFARQGVGALYLTLCLLVLYVGYSMCVLSHAAWGTALVAEYHQRSRVYGWIQAVGVIGAASVLLGPTLLSYLTKRIVEPVPMMGWFLLIAVPVTFAITSLFAHEPTPVDRPSSERLALEHNFKIMLRPDVIRNLVATLFTTFGPALTAPLYLFFFEAARGYTQNQANALLLIYILAGLVGPAFWMQIAKRTGKHHTVKIASVVYAVAQTGLLLLPRAHVAEMSFAMFSVGFVASAFPFVLRAMIADISDEVRLDTGKDFTAWLYGIATSAAKIPSTLSVGVAYSLLSLFGFKAAEGAANTPTAMWGLQTLYLVPPVACVLLGGLAMLGYRLDEKRHGEIREALQARARAMAGTPGAHDVSMSQLQPGE
jgi:Na+/melibiose symporter-like transporter